MMATPDLKYLKGPAEVTVATFSHSEKKNSGAKFIAPIKNRQSSMTMRNTYYKNKMSNDKNTLRSNSYANMPKPAE